jgi:hypothetical protein
MKIVRLAVAFLGSTVLAACGAVETETTTGSPSAEVEQTTGAVSCDKVDTDFDVDFTGCREFVGIGNVPAANARRLVPARYTLAGDAAHAVIVVRLSECKGTAVGGHKPVAAHVSQIGLSITGAGTDPTADINNYLLWYATDLGLLHGKLRAAGFDADVDKGLVFEFTPTDGAGDGVLRVAASPPRGPTYEAHGSAMAPTEAPVQFIATWWQGSTGGAMVARTTFPAIQFGSAVMTLTTTATSALAKLIGGTSLTFPLLDSFNAFPAAHMTVTGG